MSSLATAPEGAAPGAGSEPTRPSRLRFSRDGATGAALAAGLIALAFTTSGGFAEVVPAGDTWTEIVVMLLGAGACAVAVVLAGPGRAWGGATVAWFAGLAALSALSIAWSVQPDYSWQASGQTLAYLGAFAGAAALARLAPQRWPALLGALATASAALAAYALLAKVFPGTLDAGDTLGRLQAPFGYWNAVGVCAAAGLAPCLWAGARRSSGQILRGLAAPAVALLITVVVLSYSRSASLVAVIGVAVWFAVVPLRLRGAVTLALGALGAAVITGWALSHHALTTDNVALTERSSAGGSFGIVLALALVATAAAGIAGTFAVDRTRLSAATRRRIGRLLMIPVALLPVAVVIALAASSRGLTGEISHTLSTLTSTSASVGDNANRLVQFANSRPVYWGEGISVGEHAVLKGVGAAGFALAHARYTTNALPVQHAHSYVIQTFADLGLIGVALNVALLAAWGLAAGRPLARRTPWSALSSPQVAEREGLLTLAVIVLAFGVQSAIDWTWFFAGVAIPALLCAGWLAGRGPLTSPIGRARRRRPMVERPAAGAAVAGLLALALFGAWMTWQPLRSADALSASLAAASRGDRGAAFTDARDAADIDPVTVEPFPILSALYSGAGDQAAARAELVAAVNRQPDNGRTWQWLGAFDLQHHHPQLALGSLKRSLQLNRTDPSSVQLALQDRVALNARRAKP